jgi:hypothetical protein
LEFGPWTVDSLVLDTVAREDTVAIHDLSPTGFYATLRFWASNFLAERLGNLYLLRVRHMASKRFTLSSAVVDSSDYFGIHCSLSDLWLRESQNRIEFG